MNIAVVSIGGELLAGQILDSNYAWFARAAGRSGTRVDAHETVPDDRPRILEALRRALGRADLVLTIGGLGATPDDLTRGCVAEVMGRPLVFRPDVWGAAVSRYAARGLTLHESSRSMGEIPDGAEIVPNPEGVAAGILIRDGARILVCLPGVPPEFRVMVDRSVVPLLEQEMSRRDGVRGEARVLRTAGLSETLLAEAIAALIPEGIEVAWLPHAAGVDLKVTRPPGASALVEPFERFLLWLKGALDAWVYAEGDASMSDVVGRDLVARGLTIGVAESLTGGAVSAALVGTPGASRYLAGSIVAYDDRVKTRLLSVPAETLREHGAVSAPTALSMARGVRERLGVDIGVATTGIAGPTGGTTQKPIGLVWFGLSSADMEATASRSFQGGREVVIQRAAAHALLLVHRHLRGQGLAGVPFVPATVARTGA